MSKGWKVSVIVGGILLFGGLIAIFTTGKAGFSAITVLGGIILLIAADTR